MTVSILYCTPYDKSFSIRITMLYGKSSVEPLVSLVLGLRARGGGRGAGGHGVFGENLMNGWGRFIFSLGVHMVGARTAEAIAEEFDGDFEAFWRALTKYVHRQPRHLDHHRNVHDNS